MSMMRLHHFSRPLLARVRDHGDIVERMNKRRASDTKSTQTSESLARRIGVTLCKSWWAHSDYLRTFLMGVVQLQLPVQ
jgi:hypothetical protein